MAPTNKTVEGTKNCQIRLLDDDGCESHHINFTLFQNDKIVKQRTNLFT